MDFIFLNKNTATRFYGLQCFIKVCLKFVLLKYLFLTGHLLLEFLPHHLDHYSNSLQYDIRFLPFVRYGFLIAAALSLFLLFLFLIVQLLLVSFYLLLLVSSLLLLLLFFLLLFSVWLHLVFSVLAFLTLLAFSFHHRFSFRHLLVHLDSLHSFHLGYLNHFFSGLRFEPILFVQLYYFHLIVWIELNHCPDYS